VADLVTRAQHGDAAAAEELLRSVQPNVHRLALRMTATPDDAADAAQEILIKVLTRLSIYAGDAAFTTWVHRVAVNHLLDRTRSAVERHEFTFSTFAEDLLDGLSSTAQDASPDRELLAREVKHGCTLAMLTCLDRRSRVAYVLGEVFGLPSSEAAWICDVNEATYRKRLSRARAAVRAFVAEHCGLVAGEAARCHCRRRVDAAVRLGRVGPGTAEPRAHEVAAATAEMEALYDAAELVRSVPDGAASATLPARVRSVLESGRFPLVAPVATERSSSPVSDR
jgi:RNA polymerase sigma factor (sigma-70 family)